MTPEELRRDEAARWLALARTDLNAAGLLRAAEPAASLFHSQQAAEKSAKALLAAHNVVFRKTHDLTELGSQCVTLKPALAPLLREVAALTEYAVIFRYLDAPRESGDDEATSALVTATRFFDEVASLLRDSP